MPVTLRYSQRAGVMQIPQEALRKKNVLIVRGRFRWLLPALDCPSELRQRPHSVDVSGCRKTNPNLAVRRPFTLLHNDMLQCAAGQFFCEDEDTSATSAEGDDECVFRDDTLVLLEMTTRDMMEVCRDITVRGTVDVQLSTSTLAACSGRTVPFCWVQAGDLLDWTSDKGIQVRAMCRSAALRDVTAVNNT